MYSNDKKRKNIKKSFPFADKILFETLSKMLDSQTIERVLRKTGRMEKRKRMLPARLVVLLVIAMTLYSKASLPEVLNILIEGLRVHGARLLGSCLPVKSALTQARERLGVKPMVELFRALAHPAAKKKQEWGFYGGMRLVAIDGTTLNLPDTPANETFFGKPASSRGKAAWPAAAVIGLVEVGTKLIVDVFVGRYKISERKAALRMMRSVEKDMLVLWDRLFTGYSVWKSILQKKANILGRLGNSRIFKSIKTLPDGSYLASFYPTQRLREKNSGGLLVRIIEYTITDSNRSGFKEKHRLITSLLDYKLYPAKELIALYHERWEIEIGFDEIKTHLAAKTPTLRSHTPLGCLQEIYGLLITHIAIRSLMYDAASKYELDPDRLSFIDSVRIVSRAIPRMQAAKTNLLPLLYETMLDEIASKLLPIRRNRINPRVVKKKMSKFYCKRLEHYRPKQPKISFQEAVHVLN